MTEHPAWLGEFEGTGESREPVAIPPNALSPLWPDLNDRSAAPKGDGPPDDPDKPASPGVPAAEQTAEQTAEQAARQAAQPAAQPAQQPAEEVHTGAGHHADAAGIGVVAVVNRREVRPPAAPSRARVRTPRRPATGLVGMLMFALLAAFVAWMTAEPLWLAAGHATHGTVVVTKCTDGRCTGTFAGPGFTRKGVPVMGAVPTVGATAAARMTSERGIRTYVDTDPRSRTAVGLALLILCGIGIAWITGARRLPTAGARLFTTCASVAAPLALLGGMLATTF